MHFETDVKDERNSMFMGLVEEANIPKALEVISVNVQNTNVSQQQSHPNQTHNSILNQLPDQANESDMEKAREKLINMYSNIKSDKKDQNNNETLYDI